MTITYKDVYCFAGMAQFCHGLCECFESGIALRLILGAQAPMMKLGVWVQRLFEIAVAFVVVGRIKGCDGNVIEERYKVSDPP